jgi:beta-carotene ketolase (CrtO type)
MEVYDIVIIGAGHNALVCAAYLLKAGYSVLLLEGRSTPGGGATTEELMPQEAPGFKFNPCAINHLFIFLGSVIQELELHKYGLEYLPCDQVAFCPHPQEPLTQTLKDAKHSIKSTVATVLGRE